MAAVPEAADCCPESVFAARERALARARMEQGWGDPLFFADWERALFLHFEVEAASLQAAVPFELDRWKEGSAVLSLVAFTMRGMRPASGGGLFNWLSAPLATHGFLNARTYVRGADGERGIFFVREWLPNRLARCVGPFSYGLPYRLGKLDYRHHHESGDISGEVVTRCGDGRLSYRVSAFEEEPDPEGRDFLLERYTAFTSAAGLQRKFRVWHGPWNARAVTVSVTERSIVDLVPGARQAHLLAAHYAEGLSDVWMGRPRRAGGQAGFFKGRTE